MCIILVKSSFLGLILSKPSSRRSSVMSKLIKTSHTLKKGVVHLELSDLFLLY